MVSKILKVFILIFIVSCATGEKFSSVKEGMTKSEISDVLSNHDQLSRRDGGWTIYYYKDRLLSGWSWDKTDYYVVLDPKGHVYEYGHGEIDTRTSERRAQWRQQQLNNVPKTIDCNSYVTGSYINTNCKSQ